MRKMLGRLAIFALILAGLYLIPVNLALNLPVTQELLNELQPDRFSVGWKRAWSWYPLRVELRDLAADGQAPTEQWQLDAKAAGVSISLLALLEGEVRVHDLDIRDIRLRLRPRPIPGTAGTDSAGLAEYFPTIRSRDPAAPAETPSEEEGDSLHLAIDDFHVAGSHEFWVHQARGHVSGDLRGSFSLDTGTGRIGLSGGELNLALTELDIGSDRDVTGDARIRGRIDVPPANIAELSTVEVSKLPEIDAQIDVPLPDLHFVNLLFNTAGVMDLTGKGRLHGRLVYSGGEQRLGTDLMVEAPELRLSLGRFEFTGDGAVEMKSHESDESQGDLSVRFDTVDAYLKSGSGGDARRLFEGRNLSLSLHADTSESARKRKAEAQLTLSVPSMRVQDIALYNALLPTKWGVELMGGQGELSGRLVVGRQALVMELNLGSDETDVRFEDNRITTDLSLALRAQAKADTGANLDLTGTELRLGDVRLGGAGTKKAKPWQGGIKIDDGHVTVQIPAERSGVEPLSYLTETLEKQGFGKLLENADGHLGATLTVSQIDWIAGMLGRPLGLTLAGSGEIDAELVLADGRLARGTKLRIPRRRLQLGLLEHRVDGQGRADLGVVKSRGEPALRLDVAFADARVKRVAEERPAADKMQLKAEVLVPKSASKRGGTPVINLDIQSARIPDFGTFNAYFPPGTPVKLLSGEASLVGGVKMKPDDAKGELLVKVKDVRVAWDEEELSGDLRVNLLIHGGTPKDMRFDVSGSSLSLDDFKVIGKTASHGQPGWYARFQIQDAELQWQEPLHLDMKAGVTVKDTRPFVAIFDNVQGEHGWIGELATVDDLAGHLELSLDGKRAVVRDAMLGSDRINVGIKGLADASEREAMVYARYGNLTGLVEARGDKRSFSLLDARSRFDAYVPGETSLSQPGRKAGARDRSRMPATTSAQAKAADGDPGASKRAQGSVPSPQPSAEPADNKNLFLNGGQ